jgi:predicted MFS family arabinose efflux permease
MLLALAMAMLTAIGAMTPALLLVGTLLAGAGAAISNPVWQSILPQLVDHSHLKSAVALNSLGVNLARAVGPAVGGALILSFGVAAAFFADSLSYLVVIAALLWWRPKPAVHTLPTEQLVSAVLASVRYARSSAPLRRTLMRAILFFMFASAPWALLPLIARNDLKGSAGLYGIMLGGIGAGAVAGALLLPRLRQYLSTDRLVLCATLLLSFAGLGLAGTDKVPIALAMTPLLGLSWITVLTALNVTTQSILPDWVRGRGLAVYLTTFSGAMTAGSLVWGQVASMTSTQMSLAVAASLGAIIALAATRLPFPSGDEDLSPSLHWPAPAPGTPMTADAGPVMVTVEYSIPRENVSAFSLEIAALGATRRRDGAYSWGVFQDTDDHQRWLEYFLVESWIQHLRQHERVSQADKLLQMRILALHMGPEPPRVSHLIALGNTLPTALADDHLT